MNLGQTVLCFVNWYPILLWSRFYSVRTKILTNWSVLWHRRTTPFWQIRYHYWKMFLQNTTRVVSLSVISSVKPFKSKNRDKIYLDAPNTNLKKGCDEILFELSWTLHPIWIWSIQIDFIAIFRLQRFHTDYWAIKFLMKPTESQSYPK